MKNLLIYYGWLNSFNSATHSWNNEKVAQELAQYGILVFGDGLQTSTHGDYSNTQIIIPRIKVLNPNAKIFGYVSVNQTYANFKTKVDDWNTLGVHGIFFDEAGYDFGTTSTNGRIPFNDKVDYVHSRSSANLCFVNSWNSDHVLNEDNDTSYPNTTWNPDLVNSNLTSDDWYLLESFAITSTETYESMSQWDSRGQKIKEEDINVAAVSVIADGKSDGAARFDFIYVSALMWQLDAVGSSDTGYGATNSKSQMWSRPDVSRLEEEWEDPVNSLPSNGNETYRYLNYGKLTLDFTSTSESATIDIY